MKWWTDLNVFCKSVITVVFAIGTLSGIVFSIMNHEAKLAKAADLERIEKQCESEIQIVAANVQQGFSKVNKRMDRGAIMDEIRFLQSRIIFKKEMYEGKEMPASVRSDIEFMEQQIRQLEQKLNQ